MTMSENDTIPEGPEKEKPDTSWAAKLAADNTWVLHTGSRTVSKVLKFWDGENEVYTSSYNNFPTKGPVLELEDGNTFVARGESEFVPLEDKEVQYFLFVQTTVGEIAQKVAAVGSGCGMNLAKTLLLIGVALRGAARATDIAIAQAGRKKADARP